MRIELSIAIVTCNRPESLERTLVSLSKQIPKPFEVVISDDSDSTSAIDTNKTLAKRFKCKYFTGPKNGLYSNRNFVAKQCVGSHIRTMDDDHEFPEGHIQACLNAIENDPNAIWTIGEYYPMDKDRPLPAPIPGQLHPRGFSCIPKDMKHYYGISCGASIYPRFIIDNNILNLETYKFGSLYLEYGVRLFNCGYSIKFLEHTYIIHYLDLGNRSIMSESIINGARIFSMIMFSFYHRRSSVNKFLTIIEIIKGIVTKEYPVKIVLGAWHNYRKESRNFTYASSL